MKPKEQSSYKNWSVSSQNWDQRQIHFLPLLYLFPIQIGFLQKRFTNSLYRDTRVYRVSCIIIERWLSDWSIQDPRWFVCTCQDRRLGCRVPHRRHLGRRRWKVFPQREFQFNSIEATHVKKGLLKKSIFQWTELFCQTVKLNRQPAFF